MMRFRGLEIGGRQHADGGRLHPREVGYLGRTFYRIWFVGAGVWFFDALLSMHHRALGRGVAQAGIAAAFLVVGMLFRREFLRRLAKKREREKKEEKKE